jgi:hypothetical protein
LPAKSIKEAQFWTDFKNMQNSCVKQKGKNFTEKCFFRDLQILRKNCWALLGADNFKKKFSTLLRGCATYFGG